MRWNLLGWCKALVLWNFVLTSALGLQKLVLQVGLNGLLPGEEVVTKESFISICWRLIPYWLNNWEQQWGAECSSMMFEVNIKLQTTNLQTTNLPAPRPAPALCCGAPRHPTQRPNPLLEDEDTGSAPRPTPRSWRPRPATRA